MANLPKSREKIIEEAVDSIAMDAEDLGYQYLSELLEDYWDPRISREWHIWRMRDTICYVRDIPGIGNPDWEDVYEEVARRDGVPVEQVRRNLDPDIWDLWDMEFQHLVRDLKMEGIIESTENIVRAGHIGDRWGIALDRRDREVEFEIKYDDIEEAIEKELDWLIDRLFTEEDLEELSELDFMIILLTELDELIIPDYEAAFEYLQLSYETIEKLQELEDWIYQTSSALESVDRWVDMILANEWHLG